MNNELLTIYVGIIAACMVLITVTVVVTGVQAFKTMKRTHTFIDTVQDEINFLCTKTGLTLNEVNELISCLKVEVLSLGAKSFLVLHELHETVGYIHAETKSLAHKTSESITKITLGSIAIDALFKIFQKNKTK